jgi:hypothetical protein
MESHVRARLRGGVGWGQRKKERKARQKQREKEVLLRGPCDGATSCILVM